MNATPERATPIETLSQEPSTSGALGRVRSGLLPPQWLVASATKLMHPDKQVRVGIMLPEQVLEAMLSGPEVESAIRQLMQAYADSIGKSLSFCASPRISGEFRGRSHRGIARDWNYTCTDNDCWCWSSEHHNPRTP